MYPLILIVFVITADAFPQYTGRIATGLLNSHADTLDVIAYLKVSPQYTLAQKVKSQYSDELHQIQVQIDTLLHRYRLRSPTPQVNEHVPKLTSADKEILYQLIKQREQILTHERAELAHQLRTGAIVDYDNTVNDNVHEVTAKTDAEYVIKVYSQDTQFEGVTSEEVVLATPEGFVEASLPAFIIRIKHPEPILRGATFPMVVEVENYGNVSAFNVSLNVNIPAEFTIVSGETSQNLGTILPNSAKSSDTLVLIAPTTTGEYVVEAFAYSQSYNEAYERCDSSVMHISPPIRLSLLQCVDGGSGYCSQNSPILQFGLRMESIDTIVVEWTSGIRMLIMGNFVTNGIMDIDEPNLPAPYPLDIVDVSMDWLYLRWEDNSTNEDGFRIERATSPDGPFSPIATVGANVTEYMDDDLTPHTTYYYRVCGFISEPDFVAYSPYSNVAYATTGEPPVSLTQIRVVDGGSGYCSQNSHVLQFGLFNMFTVDTIFVYWPSGIIDTIVGVEADQQLTIVEGTTVNQPPLPFSLIAPQDGGYVNFADTFDWQDAVDNIPQGDIVYYDLYISSDPNFSTNVIVIDSLVESKYPVANVPWPKHMMLTNHTFKRWRKHSDIVSFYRNKHSTKSNEYYWKVKAYDRYGAITWSNETWQFELDTIAPTTPIIISPIDVYLNTDTVNFIWSQSVSKAITTKATTKLLPYDIASPYKATKFPKNVASAPVHYVFELDTTVNFSSPIIIDTVDDTSYTTYGLIDANYYWRISAYDDAGNQSNWSYATFGIDRTPPEIVNFTHYNDTSGVDSLPVYATVYDALAGLDSLLLLYNVDDTGWVHQTMTPIDTNIFVGWLTDVAGHHVHYFLRAVDKAIPPNVNVTDTVSFLILPVEEGLHLQPDIEISHHISYVKFILRGRDIILSIYDVTGRLLLRRRSPCEVIFRPASSGVYFWHTSGSICRSDKIVIVK
ncbi:ASPIC/UnbV domain-containing protein [candidate division WOR-3 bacterium]|nr:ASPIC/UnbV domain-containing protein [candidate division WOR-3 bacterium]